MTTKRKHPKSQATTTSVRLTGDLDTVPFRMLIALARGLPTGTLRVSADDMTYMQDNSQWRGSVVEKPWRADIRLRLRDAAAVALMAAELRKRLPEVKWEYDPEGPFA